MGQIILCSHNINDHEVIIGLSSYIGSLISKAKILTLLECLELGIIVDKYYVTIIAQIQFLDYCEIGSGTYNRSFLYI